MQLLKRTGRVLRLRVRTVLILVAVVGLGVGAWSDAAYRAWIHHLLGHEREAVLAAIQAPRSAVRDRVLVAALAAIVDDKSAQTHVPALLLALGGSTRSWCCRHAAPDRGTAGQPSGTLDWLVCNC